MEAIQITREMILDVYTDYVLRHNARPKNVYTFSDHLGISEQDFYQFFSGFEQIEQEFIQTLFVKSLELVENSETEYNEFSAKEKMLNLYYVFTENLTMNRSFVLFLLSGGKRHAMMRLMTLKTLHKSFVQSLYLENVTQMEHRNKDLKRITGKSREEILWVHFVSIIEFWRNDTSTGFERTDLFIEKTIDTGFEFIDPNPLKKVIDLGKFLYKEKFNKF